MKVKTSVKIAEKDKKQLQIVKRKGRVVIVKRNRKKEGRGAFAKKKARQG